MTGLHFSSIICAEDAEKSFEKKKPTHPPLEQQPPCSPAYLAEHSFLLSKLICCHGDKACYFWRIPLQEKLWCVLHDIVHSIVSTLSYVILLSCAQIKFVLMWEWCCFDFPKVLSEVWNFTENVAGRWPRQNRMYYCNLRSHVASHDG